MRASVSSGSKRSSVRVEVEFVQRLSARGDGDELDRAEILVKAQRQTPAFGSHQLLYITHGIKFARIKRHAIGWRHDARPVLICIVVKYFRIVAYKTDLRSEESRVGKECVRRVDLGGRRIIKKKKKKNK